MAEKKQTKKKATKKRLSVEEELQQALLMMQRYPQGVALSAPAAIEEMQPALRYSATGKLTEAQKKRNQKIGLYKYIEPIAESRTHTFLHGKRQKEKTVEVLCYQLNEVGRTYIRREEEKLQAEKEAELRKSAETTEGIHTALEKQSQAFEGMRASLSAIESTITTSLSQSMQEIRLGFQQDLNEVFALMQERMKELEGEFGRQTIAAKEKMEKSLQALADDSTVPLQQIQKTLEAAQQDSLVLTNAISQSLPLHKVEQSVAPPASNTSSTADPQAVYGQVLAEIPWDYHIEIPALYGRLMEKGVSLRGPGELGDILTGLARNSQVSLGPWIQPLQDIPHPEFVILHPNLNAMYFVTRRY